MIDIEERFRKKNEFRFLMLIKQRLAAVDMKPNY